MTIPDAAEVRARIGPCHTTGCGHTKAQHATEPSPTEPGKWLPAHCGVDNCPCLGWDPMTTEEWTAVMAEQHR